MTDDVIMVQLLEFVHEYADRVVVVGRPVFKHLILRVGRILQDELVILEHAAAKLGPQIVRVRV